MPAGGVLELVGERWALLVVREIAMGSHRFTDIVRGTGAPRDRVAARLRALEHAGVVAGGSTRSRRSGSTTSSPRRDGTWLPALDALAGLGIAARGQRPTTRAGALSTRR